VRGTVGASAQPSNASVATTTVLFILPCVGS
jgi:hypothetical protein